MKRLTSRGSHKKIRKELWLAIITCCLGLILLLSSLRSLVLQSHSQPAIATLSAPGLQTSSLLQPPLNSADRPGSAPKIRTPASAGRSLNFVRRDPKVTRQLSNPTPTAVNASSLPTNLASTDCQVRPSPPRKLTAEELEPLEVTLPLSRFRQGLSDRALESEHEIVQLAHPSNFGWRVLQDIQGRSVQNAPIVVLHETVGSYEGTIATFQRPHDDDDDQVSYHAVIRADGKIAYIVPPDRRAYGAGNSVFINADRQPESVQTHPKYPPSVNNFAYHISLETPEDGEEGDEATHSGYTRSQYESLAWLIAKTAVPEDRITTHQLIDRSGTRRDPRSFNVPYFLERLRSYPKTQEIAIACRIPVAFNPEAANPEAADKNAPPVLDQLQSQAHVPGRG